MAVAYVTPGAGTGVVVAGTTSAAPVVPDTRAAGNLLIMGATAKPDTVTFPTISGWTKQLDVSVGSGTPGAGTGPQRLAVYTKVSDGTETGAVTVTPTGTANVTLAGIYCWSVAAGQSFAIDVNSGSDTTAGANLSVTKGGTDRETGGDWMAVVACSTANANMGSATVTATGATYGTATERSDVGSTNGDDARLNLLDRPVSSGTATDATVFTTNITGTVTGGAAFIRLREVSGSTAVSGTDTGAGSEGTPGLLAASSLADTGALTEAAGGSATATTTDSGTGADASSLLVAFTATDSAALTATSSVVASTTVTATDSGTGTDAATATATGTTTDTAAGTEATTLAAALDRTDTGALADSATTTAATTGSDAGGLVEAATLAATITGADAGALTDTSSVNAGGSPSGTDAGNLTEAASLIVVITASDAAAFTDTASVTVSGTAVEVTDAGTATESASLVVTLTTADSGALTEQATGAGGSTTTGGRNLVLTAAVVGTRWSAQTTDRWVATTLAARHTATLENQ